MLKHRKSQMHDSARVVFRPDYMDIADAGTTDHCYMTVAEAILDLLVAQVPE